MAATIAVGVPGVTGESGNIGGPTAFTPPAVNHQGDPIEAARRTRRNAMLVIGLAALANGAALVMHIVGGFPLPALLVFTWSISAASIAALVALGGREARGLLVRLVVAGVVVGLIATVAYDAAKAALSQLDPSPYNPFEATRIFGLILVGDAASPFAIAAAGWGFHFANGMHLYDWLRSVFCARWARIATACVVTGIGWGLFLETFQLVLYPSWLGIGYLAEFRQISFLSHIVFGLSLGLMIPAALRRIGPKEAKGGLTDD